MKHKLDHDVDAFHFYTPESGICKVVAQASLPREFYPSLLNLAFCYSSAVLVRVANYEDYTNSYAIALEHQSKSALDWLRNAIERFESEWSIVDSILYSPQPSKVDETQLEALLAETLIAA